MAVNAPRRHHYIPRFLLRRFASDPRRDGAPVHQMEVASGQITTPNPVNAAVIRDFYAVEVAGERNQEAERLLAVIEDASAPLVVRLEAPRVRLDGADRYNLAFFLAILWLRTPRWRQRFQYTEEQLAETMLRNAPAEHHRAAARARGEEISLQEAERRRREVIAALDRGGVRVDAGNERHIAILLEQSPSSAWMLHQMDWTLLRAPGDAEFVIADEAVSVSELSEGGQAVGPTFPFAGTNAEMVVPLDPRFILTLRPNAELLQEIARDDGRALRNITTAQIGAQLDRPVAWEEREASAEEVEEMNLRSYAHAERWLYARDSVTLGRLKELATTIEAQRVLALRPRDPELVVVHERQGRPRQFWRAPQRPARRRRR